MFDLKLTDIFSVICTGILTAALITYFYFIYNKFFVKTKFDNDAFFNWLKGLLKESYKESGYAILLIVVVYCLGIIGGDLTERMTDTDDNNKNFVLKELRFISGLKGEGDARVEALVHDSLLTPLGTAVFRSEPVVKNANQLAGTSFFNEKAPLDKQWKNLINKKKIVSTSISSPNKYIIQVRIGSFLRITNRLTNLNQYKAVLIFPEALFYWSHLVSNFCC